MRSIHLLYIRVGIVQSLHTPMEDPTEFYDIAFTGYNESTSDTETSIYKNKGETVDNNPNEREEKKSPSGNVAPQEVKKKGGKRKLKIKENPPNTPITPMTPMTPMTPSNDTFDASDDDEPKRKQRKPKTAFQIKTEQKIRKRNAKIPNSALADKELDITKRPAVLRRVVEWGEQRKMFVAIKAISKFGPKDKNPQNVGWTYYSGPISRFETYETTATKGIIMEDNQIHQILDELTSKELQLPNGDEIDDWYKIKKIDQ